ncbi:MAG: BolA family transcriptional regulator [Asticcacaulis sp.]|nr:BolA family transcriptional regulator [Asticcacaulis sp.]
MGIIADRLKAKLNQALAPQQLEIHDDSAKHSGHAGAREGGESHFSVRVVSERFEGLNRVARQRLINTTLAEELAGPVHALSLQTLTPAEAETQDRT